MTGDVPGPAARTVLLVGANDETVHKAVRLGLRVLLLQHPTKLTAEQQRLAAVTRVLDYVEWAEVEPVVRELRAAPGFAVALSLTEAGLENAGRVNDLFGLGGTGYQVAHRMRDKVAMRRHLASTDPAAPASARLDHRADLDAFAARHGHPFIVKPADGTASIGVALVAHAGQHDEAWAAVARLRGTRTDRVSTLFVLRDFVMEEYVDGPEFSVETFSVAGRHVVVAITEKFLAPGTFAEVGHLVPARLDPSTEERIRRYTVGFLDRIGMRDGVCHVELRVGPRGPAVIESHNRVGGDAIPRLVDGAYGIDLVTYALGAPFGLVPELPGRPVARAAASTRFIVGEPGRILSIDGVEQARQRPGVLEVQISAKPGEPVRPLRDNWDRIGLVAVHAADAIAAIRSGAQVIAQDLRIRIGCGDGTIRLAHAADVAGVPPVYAGRA